MRVMRAIPSLPVPREEVEQCINCTNGTKMKKQDRVYYNAGALKLRQAKKTMHQSKKLRAKAELYCTAAARKFEKAVSCNKENDPNPLDVQPERRAAVIAKEALKRQSINKHI